MGFRLNDVDGLAAELHRLSHLRFDAVIKKNMTEIYNRGKKPALDGGLGPSAKGGTPVDTGELRISLTQSGDEVGYTKDYAPHVEFGHRTVNGGYVEGQRFLKANVDEQREIFKADLKRQLWRFI